MRPTGLEHGAFIIAFGAVLRKAAGERDAARVVSRVGFWLDDDVLLAPDLSLVPHELIPSEHERRRMSSGGPRLAVEMAYPDRDAGLLAEKVDLYLAAGVDPVLVIDPVRRLIAVHSPGQPVRLLREGDTLDGGGAIPGFAMTVADISDLVDLV